jgi:hypothetical protein
MLEEEKRLIDEALNVADSQADDQVTTESEHQSTESTNVYFRKYIQLRKYLKKSERKFLNLESSNLKAIKQIYSLLTSEQKFRLIRKNLCSHFPYFTLLFLL